MCDLTRFRTLLKGSRSNVWAQRAGLRIRWDEKRFPAYVTSDKTFRDNFQGLWKPSNSHWIDLKWKISGLLNITRPSNLSKLCGTSNTTAIAARGDMRELALGLPWPVQSGSRKLNEGSLLCLSSQVGFAAHSNPSAATAALLAMPKLASLKQV